MHRDVLLSGAHPEIVFTPRRLAKDARNPSAVQVTGILTLLGRDHEITVPVRLTVSGGRAEAEGSFVVPYVAWGLADPSVLILRVNKDVEVRFHLRGAAAPPDRGMSRSPPDRPGQELKNPPIRAEKGVSLDSVSRRRARDEEVA